jgi:MarR family transcriptional regulator, organic hydroperoxide resistance regulator
MAQRSAARRSTEQKSIGYLIKILAQLNHRRLQSVLAPYDLTPFHWLVLRCLWQENGVAVSSITERLQEVGGTMTGVLDRMEERGLVSRVRDPADRRIFRVFLTKKGQELEAELGPLVEQSRKKLLKGIVQRDLALFERIAERLMSNCKDILGSEAE